MYIMVNIVWIGEPSSPLVAVRDFLEAPSAFSVTASRAAEFLGVLRRRQAHFAGLCRYTLASPAHAVSRN